MSQDEHLDNQLRYGTDYVNLPADRFPTDRAPTWTRQSPPSNSSTESPKEIRFLHHLRPSTDIPQIARDRQMSHQQIEADNRLQQLEVIRPMDNMILLNLKYQNLQKSNHNRPLLPQYYDEYIQTFYDQTGRFIHERSGLYQTNTYNPHALSQSMPEISTSTSNQEDRDNLLHDENSLSASKQGLFQYKTFADYQAMRVRFQFSRFLLVFGSFRIVLLIHSVCLMMRVQSINELKKVNLFNVNQSTVNRITLESFSKKTIYYLKLDLIQHE